MYNNPSAQGRVLQEGMQLCNSALVSKSLATLEHISRCHMDACERGRMTTFTMLCHALYKRGLAPINNLTRPYHNSGSSWWPQGCLNWHSPCCCALNDICMLYDIPYR